MFSQVFRYVLLTITRGTRMKKTLLSTALFVVILIAFGSTSIFAQQTEAKKNKEPKTTMVKTKKAEKAPNTMVKPESKKKEGKMTKVKREKSLKTSVKTESKKTESKKLATHKAHKKHKVKKTEKTSLKEK